MDVRGFEPLPPCLQSVKQLRSATHAAPRAVESFRRLLPSATTFDLGVHQNVHQVLSPPPPVCTYIGPPLIQKPDPKASFRKVGWSQGVEATLAWSLSAGVLNPKVCLGRVLSRKAISSNSDCEKLDRSAVLGRYCRNRPLVFSFEPRYQRLCGSQK